MTRRKLRRPSHGTLVAYLALFVALGGTAYAAATITGADVVDESLTSADIQDSSLRGRDFGPGTIGGDRLQPATVTSGKIKPGAVTPERIGSIPTARVRNSVDQLSTTEGTVQVVTFDTEVHDSGDLHEGSLHPSRLTAPIAGVYAISGSLCYQPNATGHRFVEIWLNSNEATILSDTQIASNGSSEFYTCASTATQARLAAGEWVELYGSAASATSPVKIVSVSGLPNFEMTWLAP